MKITKVCHSCLIVEEGGAKFIIDPGSFSAAQNDVEGIDAVLITHEHQDHLDISSVKAMLAKNPSAQVFANAGIGAHLEKENIPYTKVEGGMQAEVKEVAVQFLGKDHAVIYEGVPSVENTALFIGGKLFHPGDGFFMPNVPVDVLALPVVAPWMKTAEGIDYAKAIKPRVAFPIHDGFIDMKVGAFFQKMPEMLLSKEGIQFTPMQNGETREF